MLHTFSNPYGGLLKAIMPSSDYQIAQEYPDNVWDEDDAVLLEFLKGGGLGIQEDAINKLIERRGSA